MSDIKLACDVVEQVKTICDKHGNNTGELINILHEAQHLHGYLPEEMQRIIASKLRIPVSKVYGVVDILHLLYNDSQRKASDFRLHGHGVLRTWFGEVAGRVQAGTRHRSRRNHPRRKVFAGLPALRSACGLAPVVMIGEKVYGRLQPVDVKKIIEELE